MTESARARRGYGALLAALLVFYLYIAAQIPYTHDDWDWGLPIGLEQLFTASVNSRYLGNAFVVLLTRSPLLKTLVMALSFALLPALELELVSRLGGESARRPALLLAANLLFVLMPSAVWRQSCGWVSGFCNFVLSALFLLGALALLYGAPERERPSVPALAGLFLYGLAMQLFLENVALYSVGVCLGFLLLRRVREGRFEPGTLALLLGCCAGLGLLFSSGVFAVLFTEGQAINATRELVPNDHVGLLPWLLRCLLYYIKYFPSLWGRNTALSCGVLLLLFLCCDRKRRAAVGAVNACFALYFLLCALFGEPALSTEKRSVYLAVAVSFLYFLTVALECLLLFGERRLLCARLLFCWLSAPLVLLPLAITTTEGGRLFFTPYVLESVFALLLLAQLPQLPRRWPTLALAVLLLCACLHLGLAYRELGAGYRERLALLEGSEGEVMLPELPHGELIWYPDPETQTRLGYFRAFYGVSGGLTVTFESGFPRYPW